jgi:hypothetical protein
MVTRLSARVLGAVSLAVLGVTARASAAPARPVPPVAAAPAAPAPASPAPAPSAPAAPAPGEAGPVAPAPVVAAPAPAPPAEAAPAPRLHHAPPAVAQPHESLVLPATIEYPHLVRRAVLLYRVLPSLGYPASAAWSEAEFLRGSPGPYVARIPAEAMRPPGVEYTVEVDLVDGRHEAVFASREAPHRVDITEDLMDVREHAALERLGGRRSVVTGSFEYVSFGSSPSPDNAATLVPDWYYRTEGAYTYRPLRLVDEFSVHVGMARGRSPVGRGEVVGLNYAAPSVRFRLGDAWRLEGEFLTSVTETGFKVGAGGLLDVGDPYGSKLRLGFESINDFGSRFWTQVDIQATTSLRLSPIVEATNMPHLDEFGVRLIGEVAYDFGNGLTVALRGGYQARHSTSGSGSAGLRLMWAF